MTMDQKAAVEKVRAEFENIGWRVTVDPIGDKVIVSGYGGPRAFRSIWIAPDGSIRTGVMA